MNTVFAKKLPKNETLNESTLRRHGVHIPKEAISFFPPLGSEDNARCSLAITVQAPGQRSVTSDALLIRYDTKSKAAKREHRLTQVPIEIATFGQPGDWLVFSRLSANSYEAAIVSTGSDVAQRIEDLTSKRWLVIEEHEVFPPEPTTIYLDHPLTAGTAPDWASAWGEDNYGPWVEFRVGDVSQRMRWIVPGSFLMGSPDNEAGRDDDEGPQHQVTISKGFWLFGTPCTQELYEAVVGDKPSEFASPKRPVENVSWTQAIEFTERLTDKIGLTFTLPTEAEWEYACRAYTTAATYAGNLEIVGLNNAPVLDAIAWYGGNSGVDWDLKNLGFDASWDEKQFEFTKCGTRIVGTRKPNDWGLYDMLGNVLEWCRDGQRKYETVSIIDPVGPTSTSADRVIRGGSWLYSARLVRAAYRDAYGPSDRFDFLGFRCSSSGKPEERSG